MAENTFFYEKITEYRTKGSKYCLVMKSGGKTALPYQINMIRYNQIGNLLPIQFFIEDGTYQYYYDISKTVSLGKELAHKKIKWNQIFSILTQLYKTISRLEDFLLDLDGIMLLPEYIYKNQESQDYWFCYYPDKTEGFEESLGTLLEFFLNHLDYEDDYSVKLTYDLYQNLRKDHIPLAQVIQKYGIISEEGTYEKDDSNIISEKTVNRDPSCRPEREQVNEDAAEDKDGSESESGDGLIRTLLPYGPDLLGGILVARMFYYLMQHHNSMSGTSFLMWIGGIILIVVGCALWSSYLGKKTICTDDEEISSSYHFCSDREVRRKEASLSEETAEYEDEYEYEYEEMIYTGSSEAHEEEDTSICDPIPATKKIRENDVIPKTLVMNEKGSKKKRSPILQSKNPDSYPDIELSMAHMVIGKVKGFVDVYLDDPCISRVHAQIDMEGERYRIEDLGSTNGTLVNGNRMKAQEKMVLQHGDFVVFADAEYEFLQDFS